MEIAILIEALMGAVLGYIVGVLIWALIVMVISKILKFSDTKFNTALKSMLLPAGVTVILTVVFLFALPKFNAGYMTAILFPLIAYFTVKKGYSIDSSASMKVAVSIFVIGAIFQAINLFV
jgi:uncharacterized membrane protein YGL010W